MVWYDSRPYRHRVRGRRDMCLVAQAMQVIQAMAPGMPSLPSKPTRATLQNLAQFCELGGLGEVDVDAALARLVLRALRAQAGECDDLGRRTRLRVVGLELALDAADLARRF